MVPGVRNEKNECDLPYISLRHLLQTQVELRCLSSCPLLSFLLGTHWEQNKNGEGLKGKQRKRRNPNKTVSVLYYTWLGLAAFFLITASTVVMTTTFSVAALNEGWWDGLAGGREGSTDEVAARREVRVCEKSSRCDHRH